MMRSLAFLALSVPLAAQTYVVDASNGPGTNYLDFPAAIASVPDGAVLRVRAGQYSAITIANKSLTILGDSRAVLVPGFTIGPLTSSQRVVIKEIGIPPRIGTTVLDVANVAGHVVLEGIEVGQFGPPFYTSSTFRIQNAADVHLVDFKQYMTTATTEFGINLELLGSSAEITGCTFLGPLQSVPTASGHPGATIRNSSVRVFRSTFQGGIGGTDYSMQFGPGGPGVAASASSIDFGTGCALTGGIGGFDPDLVGGRQIMRPGGAGLQLLQGSSARAMGTTLSGGCSSGRIFGNNGCTGTAPPWTADLTSSFAALPGVTPSARVSGTPALNSFVDVQVQAGLNEVALLAFGFSPLYAAIPSIIDFGGILTPPEIVFGPLVTDATGLASFRLTLPGNFVRDRMVWAQYFTFPGLVLPGIGSNTVSVVVRS